MFDRRTTYRKIANQQAHDSGGLAKAPVQAMLHHGKASQSLELLKKPTDVWGPIILRKGADLLVDDAGKTTIRKGDKDVEMLRAIVPSGEFWAPAEKIELLRFKGRVRELMVFLRKLWFDRSDILEHQGEHHTVYGKLTHTEDKPMYKAPTDRLRKEILSVGAPDRLVWTSMFNHDMRKTTPEEECENLEPNMCHFISKGRIPIRRSDTIYCFFINALTDHLPVVIRYLMRHIVDSVPLGRHLRSMSTESMPFYSDQIPYGLLLQVVGKSEFDSVSATLTEYARANPKFFDKGRLPMSQPLCRGISWGEIPPVEYEHYRRETLEDAPASPFIRMSEETKTLTLEKRTASGKKVTDKTGKKKLKHLGYSASNIQGPFMGQSQLEGGARPPRRVSDISPMEWVNFARRSDDVLGTSHLPQVRELAEHLKSVQSGKIWPGDGEPFDTLRAYVITDALIETQRQGFEAFAARAYRKLTNAGVDFFQPHLNLPADSLNFPVTRPGLSEELPNIGESVYTGVRKFQPVGPLPPVDIRNLSSKHDYQVDFGKNFDEQEEEPGWSWL
ncbi:hypothetical protein FUAX_26120 [Fulvitalea axinellae]|uniref:Uncharacterized protein n=2 Tax=Fulvitalea axinellae TaxID=1182444 RepID=A0AAU9DGL5_9BACT|nr:hypothetical protein FUAX_26120 [Fulvitalea axinellae]